MAGRRRGPVHAQSTATGVTGEPTAPTSGSAASTTRNVDRPSAASAWASASRSISRTHRAEQDAERTAARGLWQDEGWVFASPTGHPLNPNTDYHEWKRLLKDAGLREARLHDARHTAATVLLALRQPTPTVLSLMGWSSMSLMGWSSESMAARYQHVTDAMRTEVASQVGDLIWQPGTSGGDPAAVLVRRDSLGTVLAFAEEHAGRRAGSAAGRPADLLAAIADLRAAMPSAGPERQPPA